jgi:two-component system, chemotaxis family, chemotaxis protein CheY
MINLDTELAEQYLVESREHLDSVEADLLAIEGQTDRTGERFDERVNRAFRAVHSVKGGAGFFDLVKVRELAEHLEAVLALVRTRDLAPTQPRVGVLLKATDQLREMLDHPASSNQAGIAEMVASLSQLRLSQATANGVAAVAAHARRANTPLRILLVEDDFASRLVLHTFLSRYGECHIAVNGREAVDAFQAAILHGHTYDLICMDILMPEMDGREAVRHIRGLEETRGISSDDGAKIIMTTTVDDIREVFQCFRELCDAYLLKPIDLGSLLSQMRTYHLVA